MITKLAARARAQLPSDSVLGHGLRLLYWLLQPANMRAWHALVLKGFAASVKDVQFIQIGSNDAAFGDPIRYYILNKGWRGVMVEAVPYIHRKLKARYAGIEGLVFENVAIDQHAGLRKFYYLKEDSDPALPPYYDQLGSFLKEVLLKHEHLIPDMRERIIEADLPCATIEDICEKNGLKSFDMLHIDTEGYDYEILCSMNFEKYRPSIILFEHAHLSQRDFNAALAMLHAAGYHTNSDSRDTLAVNLSCFPRYSALTFAWKLIRWRMGARQDGKHAGIEVLCQK